MGIDSYTGKVLEGKYRLIELIGKGGMGSVYKGEHIALGKTVAVKFLHSDLSQDEQVVTRFFTEARTAATIGHEGIIDVIDVGISPDKEPFLVMEFLEGESLADTLERIGHIEIESALGVLEPALLALHAAHARGIVHRDLKPDNIFIAHMEGAPPKIKLIDFGISKFLQSGGPKMTQTGAVMGTPAYMSPEQARGSADLDHRADIFSMGVIFYEMLTGKLPFKGESFTEILVSILSDSPCPPKEAFDGFPSVAEPVILKTLEKNPAQRYQTVLELIEALRSLDGYENRHSGLIRLATHVQKTTFAAGSLGTPVHTPMGVDASEAVQRLFNPSGSGEAQVPSAVVQTPTGWSGTKVPSSSSKKKPWVFVGLVAAIISLAGIAGFVFMTNQRNTLAKPATAVSAPIEKKIIAIHVDNLPVGARLYLDGAYAIENPLQIKISDTSVSLRIELDGFEPWMISLVPNKDQTISVPALTPIKK